MPPSWADRLKANEYAAPGNETTDAPSRVLSTSDPVEPPTNAGLIIDGSTTTGSNTVGDRLSHTPQTSQGDHESTALPQDMRSLSGKEQQGADSETVDGKKNKVKFGSVEYYALYGNKYKKL